MNAGRQFSFDQDVFVATANLKNKTENLHITP
jgi:hypothetical protein